MAKKRTQQEAFENLHKAWLDFGFEVLKAIGLLWLVSKIPFLDYKDWVKERLK